VSNKFLQHNAHRYTRMSHFKTVIHEHSILNVKFSTVFSSATSQGVSHKGQKTELL